MDQCNNSRLSQKPIVHHQNMCPRNVCAHSSCVQFAIHWFNETIWNLRFVQVMKVWSFKGPLKWNFATKLSGAKEMSPWHPAGTKTCQVIWSDQNSIESMLNPCWNMLRTGQSLSLSIALQVVKDDRPTISVQHLAGWQVLVHFEESVL